MPKITAAAAALLLLFALTGCGDDDSSSASPSSEARGFAAAAPASAEATATPEPTATLSDADETFLAYVTQETPDFAATALPAMTDAEKIAAGHEACEQIAAGVDPATLRLVPNEEPTWAGYYLDSSAIFNGALTGYCPELIFDPES